MALIRTSYVDSFSSILATLNTQFSIAGTLNLQSQNVLAEDFYKRILNALFGWSLTNINETTRNAEAIDLIDEGNKLIIQVTVTNTTAKINGALDHESIKAYKEGGYRIKFVLIGKQDRPFKKATPTNPHQIPFEPRKDILLTETLVDRFSHLDPDKQFSVLHIARQEIGEEFLVRKGLIERRFSESIKTLGGKYNPQLDVHVRQDDYRLALYNPDATIEAFVNTVNLSLESLRKLSEKLRGTSLEREYAPVIDDLVESLASLSQLDKASLLNRIPGISQLIDSASYGGLEAYRHAKEASAKSALERIRVELNALSAFIYNRGLALLDKKVVIVTGHAGTGKSRYLAKLCQEAISAGCPALLLFGQDFVGDAQILDQVARSFPGASDGPSFLDEACRFANEHGGRAIIAIDALNEGDGRAFWKNHLQFCCNEASRHPEALIVLSVKRSCLKEVIPDSVLRDNATATIELDGFDWGDDAVEAFCAYYGLEIPAIPHLDDEYSNPLLLKLVCEASKKRGLGSLVPSIGFTETVKLFIDGVNERLSGDDKVGFDWHLDIVGNALREVVSQPQYRLTGSLDYGTAYESVRRRIGNDVRRPDKMLRLLEEEGVIRIYGKGSDSFVVFTYEMVGSCIEAEHLVEDVPVDGSARNHLLSNPNITDTLSQGWSQRVPEALAIILPERFGIEVFEIMDRETDDAADLFISSIKWRSRCGAPEKIDRYVRENIVGDFDRLTDLLMALIDVSTSPDSTFNGVYLHSLLVDLDSRVRDAAWSWALFENPRIDSVISWAWNRTDEIDAKGLLPTALTLSWCLSSSSREIRDKATKALSCILLREPNIALGLLDRLLPVGDDYITERLFAAIYGAASNSKDATRWHEATDRAYSFTYQGEETYPNIMVRNYTDCLVDEVAGRLGLEEDYPLAHKRGNSSWYDYTPSNEDIDSRVEQVKETYGDESPEYWNLRWLVHSMTTEYGRGTCMYGDFGRYVFGGHVSSWKNQFDDGKLSNMALGEILQKWYDADLHTQFDRRVGHYEEGNVRGFERITKKYQWISMFRLIARLLDNYPPFHEAHTYDDEYNSYCERRSELFRSKFLNWNRNGAESNRGSDVNETLDPFDYFSELSTLPEMAPDEHITSTTRTYIEAPELFNELSPLRDIDPTVLHPAGNQSDVAGDVMPEALLGLPGDIAYDVSSIGEILDATRVVVRDGARYVPLSMIVTRRDVSASTSEVHLDSACGFVASDQIDAFLSDYKGKDGSDILSIDTFYVYQREFYGGSAYALWRDFVDSERSSEGRIASAAITDYVWEPSYDRSQGDEVSRFCNPSQELVAYLSLTQGECGTWVNDRGEVICRTESSAAGRQLIIREDCLLDYLRNKHALLCRGEYFEITSHCDRQRMWVSSVRKDDGSSEYRLSDYQRFDFDPSRFI